MPVRLFGLAVFVNDKFATVAEPRPGINERIVESVAKGQSVLLDYAGLSRANATDGVWNVILYSHASTEKMTPDEVFAVKEGLATSFFRGQIGYRIKRLMVEPLRTGIGPISRKRRLGASLRSWVLLESRANRILIR